MIIPLYNIGAQHRDLSGELDEAVKQVIASDSFAGGPFVEKFEEEFAPYCGCRYAVGVGSGTEALWLSLMAAGIGPGDEVITVPNTFMATAEAVSLCGARPVFVDVDESTLNMNPELIEPAITPRTKALLPVHLYGQTANMDPILEAARKHGLMVIEDSCQAHGAKYKSGPAGSLGLAACFSFLSHQKFGGHGRSRHGGHQ